MTDIRLRVEAEEQIWRRYFRAILWPVLLRFVFTGALLVAAIVYFVTFPEDWYWPLAWVVIYPPLWWMITRPEIKRARKCRDDDLESL